MPVDYEIDSNRRLIRTSCSGPVTIAEVSTHLRALEESAGCSR